MLRKVPTRSGVPRKVLKKVLRVLCLVLLFRSKKKKSKEKVFGPNILRTSWGHSCGRPGVIHADVENFGQALETLEEQAFGGGHPWPERADVHDSSGWKVLREEKLRADFPFFVVVLF